MTARQVVDIPAAQHRNGPWTAVVLLAMGSFALGTGMFVLSGVLDSLARDLGASVGGAGLTVTVFSVASALGAPVLSAALGGRSHLPMLMTSIGMYGALSLAAAFAPNLPVLLVLRVATALAAGVYVAVAVSTAVHLVPENRRGRALAVVLGGSSVATVVGAPLGVLLAEATSWRAAFVLVALLTLPSLIGLPLAGLPQGPAAAPDLRARLAPLRSPAVVAVLTVSFLVMAGSYTLFTFVGPLFAPLDPPGGVSTVIALFGVGGVLGTAWGGVSADRWGGPKTVLVALGVATCLFVLIPLVTASAVAALAHVVVWGVVVWGCVPGQQHRLIALDPGAGPLVIALNSSAMNLGFATGSLTGGLTIDTAGADGLWLPAALWCAAGLVLHLVLTGKGRG